MTREEFDNIRTWDELLEICNDNNCSYCEDVYSFSEMNEEIQRRVDEWEGDWDSLRDYLEDQPSYSDLRNFSHFIKDDDGLFCRTSDEDYNFTDYKEDIAEWLEDHDCFDTESALETFRRFEYEDPSSVPQTITTKQFATLFE